MEQQQSLLLNIIHLFLTDFIEGTLARLEYLHTYLMREIDMYLTDYEPLNELEYE